MTDDNKRRSYAVDDVETISRRMKEIAAERDAKLAETELPSDTEPSALCEQYVNRRATLVKQDDGSWRWVGEEAIGCDFNAYWQPLIDDGILSMVEPGVELPDCEYRYANMGFTVHEEKA